MPTDPLFWGIVALSLVYSAYVAEVYRAGIESVHPSQEAAARSLGLNRWQSLSFVILPQAVRRVVPPLLNDFIGLQKDSALVALIGPVEAFRQAQIEEAATFNFTPYIGTALLFILITVPLARFTDWLIARDRRRQLAAAVTEVGAALQLEDVHKSFGHVEVLRGIDLAVRPHEVVCLIGASGSGKSTLLRCVNLLEPIDSGRILVHGRDVTRPRSRRERHPPRNRNRLSVLQPLPAHDRAAECDARAAQGARTPEGRGRAERATCSSASASPTSRTSSPTGCPAASSSVPRSCARSR